MFSHYFKTAWRNLKRNRIYSAINIAGIAIGLAAFWLIALYVGDELSYDRSFKNSDRIYRIAQHANWKGGSLDIVPTSALFATQLKANFPEVEDATRINIEGGGIIKYGDRTLKQNDICFADNSFFSLFDHHFSYGNAASALTQPQTVVITESLAKKIFGDVSKALNETIYFDGEPNKVTGVVQDFPQNSHLQFSGVRSFGHALDSDGWKSFYLYTYLLLKKGTDVKAFENKLPAFAAKTVAKEMAVTDYHMELQPLTSIHLNSHLDYELSANGSMSRIYMFVGIAVLILMIALINYMNLSTARSAMRIKEIGIRKVIGSGRRNLVGLFVSEAMLVNFISACIACVLVQLYLPFFNRLSGKNLDIWRFGILNTTAFIILVALLTGFLSGTYPAFFLSRFKMIPSLKGQLGSMHANVVFRRTLVVFQFVIAVFLVSGSLIIYEQLQYVNNKDLGFNKQQVVTFHIDDMKVRGEVPELKHALLQSPLIEGVSVAGNPIGNNDLGGRDFTFEKNGAMAQSAQMAQQLYVDEDFLKTTDIKLLQGRNFSKDLATDQYGVALINETLMKELGYTNAVGKKMQYHVNENSELSTRTIIGVVKNFHVYSLQHAIEPMVMMMPPAVNEQDNLYVKIAKGKTAAGLAYVKNTFRDFDNNNIAELHFLDENFARQYAAEQKQEQLSFIFTLLAFVIACLGLTGLVILTTVQRTKEIGIRKVLGASVISVTTLLGKDFIKLVAIATVIAIPVAWFAMDKWLQDFAYRIQIQWWMFLFSGGAAIVISVITVSIQAIKTATANPVRALRME